MSTYSQALSYLDTFVNYERQPPPNELTKAAVTLERVHQFAERIGRPADALRVIHIAGSQGKGSTAAIVASICRAAGLRTGLYTSPHLVHVRERIQVDGRAIPPADFIAQLEALRPQLDALRAEPQTRRATYYEVLTHLALRYFRDREVDVAVLEVGMGGRLDATNICRPAVCGITQIDLDHTRQLGDSIEQIAGEKAGILKAGVPAAVAPGRPEALAKIEKEAARVGSPLYVLGREFVLDEVSGADEFSIRTWCGRHDRLTLPGLPGAHQRRNAALAVALFTLAAEAGTEPAPEPGPVRADTATIREGLRLARWPGRLESVTLAGGPGLLDGAHTPLALTAALAAVKPHYPCIAAVFATHEDKNANEMLAILAEACVGAGTGIVLTHTGSPRSADPQEMLDQLRSVPARCEPDIAPALAAAREFAGADGAILVVGSLYLVGRVKALLGEADVSS